jgi:hypothetical protein
LDIVEKQTQTNKQGHELRSAAFRRSAQGGSLQEQHPLEQERGRNEQGPRSAPKQITNKHARGLRKPKHAAKRVHLEFGMQRVKDHIQQEQKGRNQHQDAEHDLEASTVAAVRTRTKTCHA